MLLVNAILENVTLAVGPTSCPMLIVGIAAGPVGPLIETPTPANNDAI